MRAAALIAALAVLAGATAAVQPARAQTDDHGNTREEATPLELGVMQTGEINPDRENDYFRIVVSDFVTLTVDITRTSGTQYLEVDLENSAGSSLEAIFGPNLRLQRQVSPGTYYIRVSIFLTGSYTIHADISAERTVSIVPGVAFVAPGASQLLTVQVHPPDPLPATARLTITTGGTESGNINNAPATVVIPAGEIAANFSINLVAGGTTANNRGTVSISNAVFLPAQQTTTVTVADLLYTLSVDNTADTFTLIVGTQPDGTVNICNRTPEVRDAILTTVRNASPTMPTIMCQAVPETRLLDITALNLIGNNLTALQNGDFANLPRLESLELGRNSLALLPVNVFDGLSTLTRLNLGTNELESLPDGLFDDLSALEGLALDNNHLHLQDENLFAGLSKLQNLVLNNNNLQSPPAGLFNGLSSLQSLDLRFHLINPLTLPAGLFNDVLDTLMTLLLDSRHRARVFIEPNVAAITNSSHNLTVRLSTSLPVDIRLPITASGNAESFLTLPATVTVPAGMTTATFNINLAGATAGDTGTIMLSTPRVTYTNTSGTLHTISQDQRPGVFNSLVNTLNIDRNTFAFSVSSQPDTLVNICDRTTGVKEIILAAQFVTETDCTRVPQTQLNTITRLDLERRVSDVEVNDFAALSNLENLNLRDNNLPSLHENVFDGLSTLRYLNLSDNNLESLPTGLLDGLSALRHLFLDHNRLTPPLPPGLFNDVLDTLTDLRLHDQANNVDLRSTVSIEPSTTTIAPGRIQTLTAQLTAPSPATVRLTIISGGNQAGNITLPDPATVTIPAGMTSAAFDITLAADATADSTGTVSLSARVLLYTDTNGAVQETTVPAVVNSLVNTLNTADNTHTFAVYSSPTATFKAFTAQSGGTEVTGDPIPITEGSSLFVRFALSRPLIAGEMLTQNYSVASDGAIDADLRLGGIRDDNNSAMFTIMGPAQIETHEVMAINDGIMEGPERFEVRFDLVFEFKGKSGLLHITPPGARTQETSLTFEIQDAAPNPSVATTARFTRNRASVTEGVSSSGVFTLTLADAPNGPATVTYIIKVTGATPNDNDISTSFIVGTTDTHVTTVTDGSAGINIAFIPESDADNTSETVTLTIISIEFTGFTLGPDDLVCPVLCPGGALDITITDNRLPTATLTRDRDSVTEGADDSSATFTLALDNAPDGPATVTYVLAVTGDTLDNGNNRSDDDISATLSGAVTAAPVIGTTAMLTTTVINSSASISIRITPLYDEDKDNELVTLAISRVAFADITLMASNIRCSQCSSDGELSITLVDAPNAEVTYALTDPYAFEPAADGTNAGTGTFTITLSNLDANRSLEGSNEHRFTFRLESGDAGATPGYGNIGAADPADTDDFNLFVEYMDSNDMPRELPSTITDDNNGYTFPPQDFRRAKRNEDGEQTYTFHVVPTRNDDGNRLMERVVFGLHVFFNGSNSQFTTAVVNNSGTAPAVTILEAPVVTLTRNASTVTEGTSSGFRLNLGAAPGGVATVTYTLVVTGDNASANNITIMTNNVINPSDLVVNGTGDTFTINANINSPSVGNIGFSANEDNGDQTDELVTLTISRVEIADVILGPDDLVCDDCDLTGALSITIEDNDEPTAKLTRNRPSVTEGTGTAATFTLALRNVPNGRSTVTFTVAIAGNDNLTLNSDHFDTESDGEAPGGVPVFNLLGTNPLFLMPSDGLLLIDITNSTANFNFHVTPLTDNNSTNEIITYAITRIKFSGGLTFGPGDIMCDDCDPRGSSSLSITFVDDDAPRTTDNALNKDSALGNDIVITESNSATVMSTSPGFFLLIHNLPDGHGDGILSVSIPQRDTNNPHRPAVGLDYQYLHDVGTLAEVFPRPPAVPDFDIAIPANQSDGNGDGPEIRFHFSAIDDAYDEDEEIITINLRVLEYPDVNLTIIPSTTTVTIRIIDDDEVSAELNKSGSPMESDGANAVPGTFTLALTETPDAAATVTYTLVGGLGIKYTADLTGGSGESLSSTARSVFIIPEANITGTAPGIEGGAQGSANVIFTITPIPDDDTNSEDVTLTIYSIEFDNGSDHGNLAAGDIGGTGITDGAQTLTIIEENTLQLRIRMFLEGALQ